MSNENNLLPEGEQLQQPGEVYNASASSTNNSQEEHQMSEEQEHFATVQADLEVDMPHIDGESTLSEEELEKKFQELELAFRTDAMMLQERLIIRKRLRDQAELNVEREINLMKSKLNNLRYLCFDSESLEQLTDLKKHLDIILASVNYLSGSAEAYGYVQNEEKMSGAVTIILRQIESIERFQSELSKSPDMDKVNSKRPQLSPILADERQEDRVMRRRSVAAVALNSPTRRRASIASVPRNSLPSDDMNGSQYGSGPSSFLTCAATSFASSSHQSSMPKAISPLASGDQMHLRMRKENRIGDIKYVQDYGNNHSAVDQSEDLLASSDEDVTVKGKGNSQSAVLKMSSSADSRIRTNSVPSEALNIIDSLRNLVKWNISLIKKSRFQFPENVHQYVPFLTTWYVVILMVAIFTSGFFTGFNRCFNFQILYSCSLVSGTVTFGIAVLKLLLRLKLLKWLIKAIVFVHVCSLYHTMHDGGFDVFLKRLGIQIETYSGHGAPI